MPVGAAPTLRRNIGGVVESRELLNRRAATTLRTVGVQISPRHRLRKPRYVYILWQMVQEFAVFAFGTCPPQPEAAERALEVMTE